MHTGDEDHIFSLKHDKIKVLFFSGGKDSFLAMRAMAREAVKQPFGMALLTTFDATSRIIAHQDISIDIVLRQAKHLGITLLGVPMHRGSKEGYVSRVRRGLQIIERHTGERIQSLVFGDLHLEHIVQWREEQLGSLGYRTMYPLLRVDYDVLEQDLEASRVPCVVSSPTVDDVSIGEVYNSALRERVVTCDIDAFGENGEFHTVAQVWSVDRSTALGVDA